MKKKVLSLQLVGLEQDSRFKIYFQPGSLRSQGGKRFILTTKLYFNK